MALEYMRTKGVDLLKDGAEIACFAHAVNGGVKIDENAMSDVEGSSPRENAPAARTARTGSAAT